MRRASKLAALVLLCICLTPGYSVYSWIWGRRERVTYDWYPDQAWNLTQNNGAHAAAMKEYETSSLWTAIAAPWTKNNIVYAWESEDLGVGFDSSHISGVQAEPGGACIALNSSMKTAMWWQEDEPYKARSACTTLTAVTGSTSWMHQNPVHQPSHYDEEVMQGAIAKFSDGYTCGLHCDYYEDGEDEEWVGLLCALSTDNGRSWFSQQTVHDYIDPAEAEFGYPSLAVDVGGAAAYVMYVYTEDEDAVLFCKSTDHGLAWGSAVTLDEGDGVSEPCIAFKGSLLFACWTKTIGTRTKVVYRWSTNGGDGWNPVLAQPPAELPLWTDWTYAAPNATVFQTAGGAYKVVVGYEVQRTTSPACMGVQSSFGSLWGTTWRWGRSGGWRIHRRTGSSIRL